jgi:hypothetical protein
MRMFKILSDFSPVWGGNAYWITGITNFLDLIQHPALMPVMTAEAVSDFQLADCFSWFRLPYTLLLGLIL